MEGFIGKFGRGVGADLLDDLGRRAPVTHRRTTGDQPSHWTEQILRTRTHSWLHRNTTNLMAEDLCLEVSLVDARGTKNVPGRKSDVQECQWLVWYAASMFLANSGDPRCPDNVAVAGSARQRRRTMHPANAKGPHRDERAVAHCHKRYQRHQWTGVREQRLVISWSGSGIRAQ